MPRYGDLDKLEQELNERLRDLREEYGDYDAYTDGFDEAVERVEQAPTADVAPVVHAHWIRTNSGKWRCSRCRGRHDRPKRYCGECGARMNEQKAGDNDG